MVNHILDLNIQTSLNAANLVIKFGLFTVVSEVAVFIGPIAYGVASDYFHSQKIPLAFLLLSMVIGHYLIWQTTKHLKNKL